MLNVALAMFGNSKLSEFWNTFDGPRYFPKIVIIIKGLKIF